MQSNVPFFELCVLNKTMLKWENFSQICLCQEEKLHAFLTYPVPGRLNYYAL